MIAFKNDYNEQQKQSGNGRALRCYRPPYIQTNSCIWISSHFTKIRPQRY